MTAIVQIQFNQKQITSTMKALCSNQYLEIISAKYNYYTVKYIIASEGQWKKEHNGKL